jgi:hypothetical protein
LRARNCRQSRATYARTEAGSNDRITAKLYASRAVSGSRARTPECDAMLSALAAFKACPNADDDDREGIDT